MFSIIPKIKHRHPLSLSLSLGNNTLQKQVLFSQLFHDFNSGLQSTVANGYLQGAYLCDKLIMRLNRIILSTNKLYRQVNKIYLFADNLSVPRDKIFHYSYISTLCSVIVSQFVDIISYFYAKVTRYCVSISQCSKRKTTTLNA